MAWRLENAQVPLMQPHEAARLGVSARLGVRRLHQARCGCAPAGLPLAPWPWQPSPAVAAAPPGKKGRWHAERDASVLLYFGLSAAAYFLDNVHLALVVLNLNLYNIALCLRLKVGQGEGKRQRGCVRGVALAGGMVPGAAGRSPGQLCAGSSSRCMLPGGGTLGSALLLSAAKHSSLAAR